MRAWGVVAVAVVSSATAIAINYATTLQRSWWLWIVVVVLTGIGAALAYATRPKDPPPRAPGGDTSNTIQGGATGNVVQARDITGGVVINREPDARPGDATSD